MSNMRFEKTNQKKALKGKGFYIALGICLIAIGAAAWTTYDSVIEFMSPEEIQVESQQPKKETELQAAEQQAGNTVSGIKTEISEPAEQETDAEPVEETAVETKEADNLIVFPTGKEVMKAFSDTNPVYSKTFGDWRVHNATDFKAEQGSKVKAVTSGKVVDIYDDPAFGMTIVIEHDGGFTAYYCGLGDTTLVQKDQTISAGDDIGSINDIPSEISDGSHLHFAIKKEDKWVDPMTILQTDSEE